MRALDRPAAALSWRMTRFVMTGIKGVISTLDLLDWSSNVMMSLGQEALLCLKVHNIR